MPDLQFYFDKFEQFTKTHPGPIPMSVKLSDQESQIVVGTCVHGIETGSLPAVVAFISESVQNGRPLPWTFVLGNPTAVLAGKRFVESDLNRQFDFMSPTKGNLQPHNLEKKRALELASVLKTSQFFLDFHQTNLPAAEPFYIFGFQERSYFWARALEGAQVLVTRDARLPFEGGSLCADEFVRLNGAAAVTLELGEKGINDQATTLTTRVLRSLAALTAGQNLLDLKFLDHLRTQAYNCPELKFLQTVHKEPFLGQTLRPQLNNLFRFEKDCVVGKSLNGEDVTMPVSGCILFPKYPHRHADGTLAEAMVGDLFHIVAPMGEHPLKAFGG